MKRILSVLWLTSIWVVLWGQIDVRSVLGGLLVAFLLGAGIPSSAPVDADAVRPWAILRFVIFFIGSIIRSNAIVAWEIITPGLRVREGIVAVPLYGASDLVVSLVAHAIGGTPGTLVVDIDRGDPTIVYVHILHMRSIEHVRLNILDLARRFVAAFGTRRSLEELENSIREQEAVLAEIAATTAKDEL